MKRLLLWAWLAHRGSGAAYRRVSRGAAWEVPTADTRAYRDRLSQMGHRFGVPRNLLWKTPGQWHTVQIAEVGLRADMPRRKCN